ncbi:MAG: hypothetical protein ACKVZJ_07125 [Phycisphaerales bacterium]
MPNEVAAKRFVAEADVLGRSGSGSVGSAAAARRVAPMWRRALMWLPVVATVIFAILAAVREFGRL